MSQTKSLILGDLNLNLTHPTITCHCEGGRLEVLTTLVEAYEQQHYPIEPPSPLEAILYHLESRHQGVSLFIDSLKRRGVSQEVINAALNDLMGVSALSRGA